MSGEYDSAPIRSLSFLYVSACRRSASQTIRLLRSNSLKLSSSIRNASRISSTEEVEDGDGFTIGGYATDVYV